MVNCNETYKSYWHKLIGKEHFFQKKSHSIIANLVVLLLLMILNHVRTIFCHPTVWALLLFAYCLLFYLMSYFLNKQKTGIVWGLSSGLFVTVFAYLLIFVVNSTEFPFLHTFIVGFPFYFYIVHLLGRVINECFATGMRRIKIAFFVPVIVGICVTICAGVKFFEAASIINHTDEEHYETLPKDFMTEHIIGMRFKYHTEICLYDGWRPPVHEPLLVVGLWMNGMRDPLRQLTLEERLQLYQNLFPDKPYKVDCGCGENYNTDELWLH